MDTAQDGSLFHREDILEAVAQSDWRDQPVHAGAWLLASAGLAILALEFAVLSPIAMGPTEFSAGNESLWLYPFHALARWLGQAGIGIESAWYLISAFSVALVVPSIGFALRMLGIGGRLSFVVAILSVLTPVAWAYGRLPSNFGLGVVGSALALAMALAPSDQTRAGERGYGVRLGASLLFAGLLNPFNAFLALPLAAAGWSQGKWRGLVPVLVAAGPAWMFFRSAIAFHSMSGILLPLDLTAFWLWPLSLGALSLLAPWAWSGAEEKSPPPAWLWIWIGVGALIPLPLVIPALAALAARALTRFARPDNAMRVCMAICAIQGIGIWICASWLSETSVEGLAAAQPSLFREGDVVWIETPATRGGRARSRRSQYLLRRRFGVDVAHFNQGQQAASEGRQILLPTGIVQPEGQAKPWVLDPATGEIHRAEASGDGSE